jgi:hypothetical protein
MYSMTCKIDLMPVFVNEPGFFGNLQKRKFHDAQCKKKVYIPFGCGRHPKGRTNRGGTKMLLQFEKFKKQSNGVQIKIVNFSVFFVFLIIIFTILRDSKSN